MFGSWMCLITYKNAGIVAFAVLGAFSVFLRTLWGSFGLIVSPSGHPPTLSDLDLVTLDLTSFVIIHAKHLLLALSYVMLIRCKHVGLQQLLRR